MHSIVAETCTLKDLLYQNSIKSKYPLENYLLNVPMNMLPNELVTWDNVNLLSKIISAATTKGA